METMVTFPYMEKMTNQTQSIDLVFRLLKTNNSKLKTIYIPYPPLALHYILVL